MKSKLSKLDAMRQLCGEIRDDDGVDPRKIKKQEVSSRFEKRDRQLCAQVRRVLDLILPEMVLRNGGVNISVSRVKPAPDISRLRVWYVVFDGELFDLDGLLQNLRGQLRNEIALEISRKKVPDLVFQQELGEEVENG